MKEIDQNDLHPHGKWLHIMVQEILICNSVPAY